MREKICITLAVLVLLFQFFAFILIQICPGGQGVCA
jgi:hypothetical protein